MRLLSLVFVFLSLACCHAQDQQHMGKYIRFELVGKSGQIRVFPANNTRGDVYTQLKWNKLEEWDPQGNKVQSVNEFASQQVSWGTPYTTTVQGNNATATTLTGSVTVGNNGNGNGNGAGTGVIVPLNITIFLFDRTVTIQNGNSTVDVNINSIKFNVDITGWPFKSPNNTLAFGVSLDSMGGRSATQDNDQDDVAAGSGSKGGRAQKIQFGPGSLVSPKNALIDGVDTPIIVKYEGNRNLVWQFPSFKTLKYDPTLGTDVTVTGNFGTMIQPSLFMFILIAFCTYLVRA